MQTYKALNLNIPDALRREFAAMLARVHFEFEQNKNVNVVRKVRGMMSPCSLNWGEMRRLIAHVRRGAVPSSKRNCFPPDAPQNMIATQNLLTRYRDQSAEVRRLRKDHML